MKLLEGVHKELRPINEDIDYERFSVRLRALPDKRGAKKEKRS
jgi:hypothetical protein